MSSPRVHSRRIFLFCILLLTAAAAAAEPVRLIPESFADIAAKISPAVVNISALRLPQQVSQQYYDPQARQFYENFFGPQVYQPSVSMGSGVIVDRRGYILTNNHVVAHASEIAVKLQDGKEYAAQVVGTDPKSDLAVLKIAGRSSWPAAEMGDSDKVRVGDWVIAVGSPFGLEQTVTSGIISAKGRTIGQGPYDDFLQTDASINPGNSGGPLVDMAGKVIGINTVIQTTSGGSLGIGFAVPINMAAKIYDDLVKTGVVHRGWLGVVIQGLTKNLAQYFRLAEAKGVLISGVVEKGPAAQAGVRPGDVILKINGREVDNPNALQRTVAQLPAGKYAKLTLWRSGKRITARIRLGDQAAVEAGTVKSLPSAPPPAAASAGPEFPDLGLQTENLTPEKARQLGTRDTAGVLVSAVKTGSPADGAGLQAGDIIRELNRRRIHNQEEYQQTLRSLKPDADLLLLIERNGYVIYVAMKVPS